MLRSIGERAYARQHYRIGSSDNLGAVGDVGIATYRPKPAFDALQISLAIINNGNHRLLSAFLVEESVNGACTPIPYKEPLVEGSSPAMRGLISSAWHIARPTALKHASTM